MGLRVVVCKKRGASTTLETLTQFILHGCPEDTIPRRMTGGGDLGAVAAEDLGELDGDVPSAHHQRPLREVGQEERL